MRIVTATAFTLLLLLSAAPSHAAILQYEGSSNVLPDDAEWNWGYANVGSASATASGGVTTLDTTAANATHAGYTTLIPDLLSTGFTHDSSIPLNAATGFEVDFTIKLLSESHTSNDRAGFSVIALSNSGPALGIELAFWTDEIWAQNSDFTHGESSARSTPPPRSRTTSSISVATPIRCLLTIHKSSPVTFGITRLLILASLLIRTSPTINQTSSSSATILRRPRPACKSPNSWSCPNHQA